MKSIGAEKLRGRRGAMLLATGALLGAIVVGPGGSIAASMLKFNQTTADKRYVKSGSVLTAGRVIDTKLPGFTSSTFAPVAQTVIKAPTAGLLEITGTISADDDSLAGEGKLQYRLRVNGTPLTTVPEAFQLDLGDGTLPGGVKRQNGTVTGVVKVAAPGVQTIVLEAQEKGTGSALQGRSLSAVFVPAGKFPKLAVKKKKTTTGTGKVPTTSGNVGP